MDTVALGLKVAELRDERGLTLDELAERAKVHPNTVRNIEGGAESMQLRTLVSLCRVLGIETAALLDSVRPKRQRRKCKTK